MTQLQQILSKNEYSFKSNVAKGNYSKYTERFCSSGVSCKKGVNSGFHQMVMVKPNIKVQHSRVKVTFYLINNYLVDSGIQLSDNRA